MRKFGVIWLMHLLATVTGWYGLAAIAQGVADSSAPPVLPLVVFDFIVQLLTLPIAFFGIRLYPAGIGGFSPGSLLAFLALAAVNSAVVVGIIVAVARALMRRSTTAE